MTFVRGRAEARWLPSRHHFALFRLYAFLRLRNARPEPREGLVLVVDRHQTAVEHHATSAWIVATVACYFAATLFAGLPIVVAFLVAIPLAAVAVEVPLVSVGLLTRGNGGVNAFVLMLGFVGVAAYFARHPSWARFAAWQVLSIVAVNAIAAAIVFALRAPIERLERGVTSAS